MEKIKGIIQSVTKEDAVSKKTGKPYIRWVFQIDDKNYSTFDGGIGDNFKAGESVEMEGEQDGQFWNMKTMIALNKMSDQEAEEIKMEKPGYPAQKKHIDLKDWTQRLIIRQSSLNRATEVMHIMPEERRKDTVKAITDMAEEFEKWVLR